MSKNARDTRTPNFRERRKGYDMIAWASEQADAYDRACVCPERFVHENMRDAGDKECWFCGWDFKKGGGE